MICPTRKTRMKTRWMKGSLYSSYLADLLFEDVIRCFVNNSSLRVSSLVPSPAPDSSISHALWKYGMYGKKVYAIVINLKEQLQASMPSVLHCNQQSTSMVMSSCTRRATLQQLQVAGPYRYKSLNTSGNESVSSLTHDQAGKNVL